MYRSPYLWLWALCIFGGCSSSIHNQSIINGGCNLPIATSAQQPLSIAFNGVTCFVIRYGNSVVLTDPFVSNPTSKQVVFGKIYPDTLMINANYSNADLADTKLVLISHAHYDHLMDLPPLLPRLPNQTVVAGSNTTKHILAAAKPQQPVLALNDVAGTDSTLGQWIYSTDSTVRTMAFVSSHPAHFMGITLFPGPYTEDLEAIPVKGNEYKRGLPLSYLIDFMEGGKPVYRVFSQSSSAHGSKGLFPKTMLAEKSVDVVLISQAVKGKETEYSELVINHCNAPIVFCTHWENFFRSTDQPLKTVPKAKVEANYQYLVSTFADSMAIILPKPGSHYTIQP
jgi:L-ascorbate metabolism protein UlaG (beta-lactamase superfamily)